MEFLIISILSIIVSALYLKYAPMHDLRMAIYSAEDLNAAMNVRKLQKEENESRKESTASS
jgi:hypothetical protein